MAMPLVHGAWPGGISPPLPQDELRETVKNNRKENGRNGYNLNWIGLTCQGQIWMADSCLSIRFTWSWEGGLTIWADLQTLRRMMKRKTSALVQWPLKGNCLTIMLVLFVCFTRIYILDEILLGVSLNEVSHSCCNLYKRLHAPHTRLGKINYCLLESDWFEKKKC